MHALASERHPLESGEREARRVARAHADEHDGRRRTCTAEVAGEPKHPAERDVGGPDEPLHGTTALRAKSAQVTLPVAGERSEHQVRRRDVRSPIVDHEEPATGAERLRLPAGEGAFQVDDHGHGAGRRGEQARQRRLVVGEEDGRARAREPQPGERRRIR